MPFQPINFANIQPMGNPAMRDFVDSLVSGYKSGLVPAQMRRQEEKENLSNQMLSKELEYLEPMQQAKLALLNAQRERALREEPQQLTEMENLIGGLGRIKEQYGEDSPEFMLANQLIQRGALKGMKGMSGQGADMATRAFITQNQKLVQSIDNAIPMIDELKKFRSPGQLIEKYINPNPQAKYEAMTSTITDSLVNALNLPKTNESIALVGKIVGKRRLESDKAYDKRLQDLKDELLERKKKSLEVLKSGQAFSEDENESKSGVLVYNPKTGRLE